MNSCALESRDQGLEITTLTIGLQISHGGRTFLAENYYNTPRALAKKFVARMLTRDLFAVADIVHGIIEKIKSAVF